MLRLCSLTYLQIVDLICGALVVPQCAAVCTLLYVEWNGILLRCAQPNLQSLLLRCCRWGSNNTGLNLNGVHY